jgi:LPS-assembly lipoprotein
MSRSAIPARAGIQVQAPGTRRESERVRRAFLVVLACATLALTACGFKLRGQQTFPFDTISVPLNSPLGFELKRNIVAANEQTKLVANAADADAVLSIIGEAQEKVILSLNTQGRVREYQLRYRVVFRVSSPKGVDLVPPTSLLLTRDITFNDQVLAKETEEAQLFREMRSDVVQQIIRRLAAATPAVVDEEQ